MNGVPLRVTGGASDRLSCGCQPARHKSAYQPRLLDLFCGAGGCSVGYRRAGFRVTGVDIAMHPDYPFELWVLDALEVLARVAAGEPIPYGEYEDIRTGLVLEPLAWALRHEPEWLAWEQVPTVLPVWEACAEVLRADGYSVAVGVLHAEEYGVPQTRKRAVLVASRTRAVSLPTPTHTRYRKGKPRQDDSMAGLLPWVSMADALGWGMNARPSHTATGGDPQARGERGNPDSAECCASGRCEVCAPGGFGGSRHWGVSDA